MLSVRRALASRASVVVTCACARARAAAPSFCGSLVSQATRGAATEQLWRQRGPTAPEASGIWRLGRLRSTGNATGEPAVAARAISVAQQWKDQHTCGGSCFSRTPEQRHLKSRGQQSLGWHRSHAPLRRLSSSARDEDPDGGTSSAESRIERTQPWRRRLRPSMNPWVIVDAIRQPWLLLDAALSKAGTAVHHSALDQFIAWLRGKSLFFPFGFFPDGFGNVHVPATFYSDFQRWMEEQRAGTLTPEPIDVVMGPRLADEEAEATAFSDTASGVVVREGWFPTPFSRLDMLPPESAVARFQLVIPETWDVPYLRGAGAPPGQLRPHGDAASTLGARMTGASGTNPAHTASLVGSTTVSSAGAQGGEDETRGPGTETDDDPAAAALRLAKTRPIAIVLAGTGEQGFSRRRHCVSFPLARMGIASLVLESPFYGTRRPRGQKASKLRQVSDLPVLGRATIEEARSLVHWLRTACGETGPLVLTGTSMGGLHSAMTASVSPHDVGVASWLGPTSAAPVFTEGALAGACEWQSLVASSTDEQLEEGLRAFERAFSGGGLGTQDAADESGSMGGADASMTHAKRQMRRFLALTCLTNFPVPRRPESAVFVVASEDQYVLPERSAEQWRTIENNWEGCTIKRIRAGHVSASIFPRESSAEVVQDVVRRLLKPPRDALSPPQDTGKVGTALNDNADSMVRCSGEDVPGRMSAAAQPYDGHRDIEEELQLRS